MFPRQTFQRHALSSLPRQPYLQQRCFFMNMARRPVGSTIATNTTTTTKTPFLYRPPPQQQLLLHHHYQQPFLFPPRRSFSVWRIPIYLATTSKWKRRLTVLGSLAGITTIGAILGPAFWIVIGGVATVATWRVWRATNQWWQLINNTTTPQAVEQQAKSLYQVLKRQVGYHRGAEDVRQAAIEKIMQWAHTDQGHHILFNELNLGHIDDIDFYPVHSTTSTSRTISSNGQEQTERHIYIEFWAQDDNTPGYRGGSCCVHVDAAVDNRGSIILKDIRLAAPGWHADEHIPLKQQSPTTPDGRVIEGEYRDVQ